MSVYRYNFRVNISRPSSDNVRRRSVKWLKARRKGEKAARLVDRDGTFSQSFGEF